MIWCCKECVAPKRHPGCHDRCPEYIEQKAIHEAERAEKRRKKAIEDGLDAQLASGVRRANKVWYKKKGL
jgi:hypothetical protein